MAQPVALFSADAHDELLDLEALIAMNAGEQRAELIIAQLREIARLLSYWPGMGKERVYGGRSAFAFPVDRWIIIYEPLPRLDGINVLHVVDSSRDLPNLPVGRGG